MKYLIRARTSALIIKNNNVLLIEFNDENGLHYNLPGGGGGIRRNLLEEKH
ncbi:hypothetical protein [Bacillus cereus]|uniref:hypothetical protein n=1 Tax=Bacillus cereus TaxID=1396 RepID=UPI003D65470B